MAVDNVGGIEYTVDANVDPLLKANKEADKSLDKLDKGFDDTAKSADKFDKSVKKTAEEVEKANGWYRDAGGRLRDLKGRFVSAARQAEAFGDSVDDSNKKTKRFNLNLSKVSSSVKKVTDNVKSGVVAVTAFTAAMTAATVKAAEAGRQLDTMAKLSNTTVERFQELAAGAQTVGVSTEKLGDIFKDTQDKIGDFINTGGGELKDYFENIAPLVNQTAEEFKNLSGPDALIKFQQGLEAANLSASEQIFFLESLANDASLLSPLLKNNAAGFKEAADRAKELNLILSQSEVDQLKEVSNEWNILLNIIGKATQKIVAENGPEIVAAFKSISESVVAASKHIGQFFDSFKDPSALSSIESVEAQIARVQNVLNAVREGGGSNERILELNGELFVLQQRLEELQKAKPLVIEVTGGAGQDKPKRLVSPTIFDTEQGGFGTVQEGGPSAQNEALQQSLGVTEQMATQIETLDMQMMNLSSTISDSLVSSVMSFSDTFGQTMAQAITDGDSLGDTLRNLAGTLGTQLLGSLISIGAQYAINAALSASADQTMAASSTAATAASTAAGVASAGALAAAYAPAATAASIATFGAAATTGTAAMTTAYATGNSLAIAGGRLHGGPVAAGSNYEVTENGKPEMLTVGNKSILMMGNQSGKVTSNADLTSGGGMGGTVVNIYNNSSNSEATATSRTQDGKEIIDVVVADLNGRGKIHRGILNSTTANNKTR
jgi:hypothetical protein